MKITIEILNEEYLGEDDGLVVQVPPVFDRAKREKLLDRFLKNGYVFELRRLP